MTVIDQDDLKGEEVIFGNSFVFSMSLSLSLSLSLMRRHDQDDERASRLICW